MTTHMPEFDIANRGKNYRRANDTLPSARHHEFLQTFHKINPKPGDVIVECGTGNGFLTIPLAQAVGPTGHVFTLDDSQSNLEAVTKKAHALGLHNNITTVHLDQEYFRTGIFPVKSACADTIATLATFHHYDDMRLAALKEFRRILKKNGKIVIGDVEHDTKPQKYFDDFVHHICSTGHDHRFMTKEILSILAEESGLVVEAWERIYVPWQFNSLETMGTFLHTIHDATCSMSESIAAADRFLGTMRFDDRILLHWELYFATLRAR